MLLYSQQEQYRLVQGTGTGEKMRTLYRLVYKNGDHGAWDDDIDRIRKYAKFFHAEIESREFEMWDEKQKESEDKE